MLLPRKRLGSYRWSDKNKPETKLEDYEILQRITNMLSESTGFFSYKGRIRVVEPPTGIGGKVKPISDGEVAQAILSGINKNGDVDRTIEGINGLLLSIKNKLRDIQGDEKYLEKTDLESFLNNDLPFMLEDNCEILLA
jgi:hypothetical protein